ncbi:MAG: hypothetical protein NC040_09970 [Muribaculaceae bacterium]|nr:hypothetical protein [Alistipes senegalensis]MCM1474375.1 hypothetical protein [Muribaculaceae bacterium]
MIQILFEGLIRVMREYVSEKSKYLQKVNDIQANWEYSDQKKGELTANAKAEFSAKKEQYIKKFTDNTEQIKKVFKDKQKDFRLDNPALNNAMFFIVNVGKKKDSDFSVSPELIENIASEFIGDTRSLNMLLSVAESNGLSKTALDEIRKFAYSDAELDAVLEKFVNALDGGTIVDYVATNLNKVAYKCNIKLDYEVHDEIGHNTLIRKAMGLN